jgi:hypothetical protein
VAAELDGLVAEISVRRSELDEEDARAAGLARVAEDLHTSARSRCP